MEESSFVLKELIYFFILPPALTCLIEIPIVYFALKLKNCLFIGAVNVATNLTLQFLAIAVQYAFPGGRALFIIIMEIAVIPVAEALLYSFLSERTGKCFLVSYIANAASFTVGLLIGLTPIRSLFGIG